MLRSSGRLEILASDGNPEMSLDLKLGPTDFTKETPKLVHHGDHVYYLSTKANCVVKIHTSTLEQTEFKSPKGALVDFDQSFLSNSPVYILSKEGEISAMYNTDSTETTVLKLEPTFPAVKLKKMYSDHFLVDLYDEDTGTNHLHLVDIQAKTSVACEEIQHDSEEHITSILLFKPRKNIEPFACWVFESLYLFARFNRELIPLWLCSVDHRAYSCCYFQDDTWILASAYSHMASVRIHFPERLRL